MHKTREKSLLQPRERKRFSGQRIGTHHKERGSISLFLSRNEGVSFAFAAHVYEKDEWEKREKDYNEVTGSLCTDTLRGNHFCLVLLM